MSAEIGHFSLVLSLVFSILIVIIPTIGIYQGKVALAQLSRPLVWGQMAFIFIAFISLMHAFLTDNFALKYVAENSNSQLPIMFKFSALWGAHEGSLLLWMFFLSMWSVLVSIFSKKIPSNFINQVLVVLGFISSGFLIFLLFFSNPFATLAIALEEGVELNPLLQDIGLIIHPPMLYIGYVGMVVPFAFAISALIQGRADSSWLRWIRPWSLVAWSFLTIGITIGSWWAYYELGWGGWWFWDPVENASFMPWLIATALIHSLSVSEKRGAFKQWTILLAISGFSLSLLGFFLVRSGVLTSVHAFSTDPTRGLFILVFMFIVIGVSLIIYTWRYNFIRQINKFSVISRDTGLLINNIIFVSATICVLLGTLYPIIFDALKLGKISVGAPYFNTVFIPILFPAVILMAITPFLHWKKDNFYRILKILKFNWIIIFIVCVLLALFIIDNVFVFLAMSVFIWIFIHSFYLLVKKLQTKTKLTTSFVGMIIAHLGIAVFILGATVTTQLGIEKDVEMQIGETKYIGEYSFKFNGVEQFSKDNYKGLRANIVVANINNAKIINLKPEKRFYTTGMPMTEAAIDAAFIRDIYISLGDSLENGNWSLRIYYKPMVRMIWLGAIMIALGALLAALDRRYRLQNK